MVPTKVIVGGKSLKSPQRIGAICVVILVSARGTKKNSPGDSVCISVPNLSPCFFPRSVAPRSLIVRKIGIRIAVKLTHLFEMQIEKLGDNRV